MKNLSLHILRIEIHCLFETNTHFEAQVVPEQMAQDKSLFVCLALYPANSHKNLH